MAGRRSDTLRSLHPHAYDWHDGHTDHHADEDLERSLGVAHPHTTVPEFGGNPQAAGAGVSTYGGIANHYGNIIPGKHTDLNHYPGLERSEPKLDNLIQHHDFNVYYAGGKYGKPKLSEKNYNTNHLMIYDPTPKSGGDFQDESLTRTWRKAHELSHALTYPRINEIYGEGRRLGRLGVRSPREAKRAVHWEWLAAHRQRKIHEQLGHHIPDSVFHKELNTIMHDAVHRAIHGKFTEPASEGFVPHSRLIPLEHSLDLVDQHAGTLGLRHAGDTLKMKRQRDAMSKSVDLYVAVPDDVNKAVGAVGAAGARTLRMPNPSPTSAGLPGGGAGGRGGKVLGYRSSGAPVYESERQARSGRGHASGLTGVTAKEFDKLSKLRSAPQAEADEQPPAQQQEPAYVADEQEAEPGLPTEIGKYQHSGINPGSFAKNHGQRMKDHAGVDHHILYSGRDPSGRGYYVVHSSDTNQLHRIDAKELSDYVRHMDSLHVAGQKSKAADRAERARWEESLGVNKSFDLYVAVDQLSKAVPVGTVHQWADGVSYKKVKDGEWIPVTDPGHPDHPQDAQGDPAEGNFPIEGGEPTSDPWRQQFAKYGLTKFPPAGTPPEDVTVDLSGDIHSHSVLSFRNLKTGKIVNCYTEEFHRRNAQMKWDRVLQLTPKVLKGLDKFLKPFLAKRKKEGSTKSDAAINRDYQSAVIVHTIMRTGLRRGAGQHAAVGVATLRAEHVTVTGDTVNFRFPGKMGVENTRTVKDKSFAKLYRSLLRGKDPGDRIFPDTSGRNALLLMRRHMPKEFKLHDFRTLKATKIAADAFEKFAGPPPPLPASAAAAKKSLRNAVISVSKEVANFLNESPATAEGSYIHPNVINAWVERVGGADLIKAQKDVRLFEYAKHLYPNVEAYTPLPESEEEAVDYYPLPEWLREKDSMNKGLFLDSGLFLSKAQKNEEPDPGTVSWKISKLVAEGKPHKQAVAIALQMGRDKKLRKGVEVRTQIPKPSGHFQLNTPEELRHILKNGHFSILSAGRSASDPKEKHLPWNHEKFTARHESLRRDLDHHGFRYTEVDGMYGGPEKSFIVYHGNVPSHPDTNERSFLVHHDHPSEHALIRGLGKKYNQESVIHSREGVNEMHYTGGRHTATHHKGAGHIEHAPDTADYWTKVHHITGGKPAYTKFSLNFDWGSHHAHDDAMHKAVSAEEDAENAKIGKKRYRGVTGPSTPDRPDRGRDWGGDEASFDSPQERAEAEKSLALFLDSSLF